MSLTIKADLFIDNQWHPSSSGRRFTTRDPATEEAIAEVALAITADVDGAVHSSHRAMQGEWRRMAPERRSELISKLVDLIEAHKDDIAYLETRDMGKPLRESYANVARSVRTCLTPRQPR